MQTTLLLESEGLSSDGDLRWGRKSKGEDVGEGIKASKAVFEALWSGGARNSEICS